MTEVEARKGERLGSFLARPVGMLARGLYDLQVTGREHVPREGSAIIVANHMGFLDGPLAYLALPRPAHFFVKRSMFSGPAGTLLRGVGQVPITQSSADREAISKARDILRAGGVVGIFPEGTRGSGDVAAVQRGAAFLAVGMQAPVIPLAIEGSRGASKNAWPRLRSTIRLTFGPAFTLHDDETVKEVTGRERVATASDILKDRLAEHIRSIRSPS